MTQLYLPHLNLEDLGNASYLDHSIWVSLHRDQQQHLSTPPEIVMIHELVHFAQFIGTIEGAYWLIKNLEWIDDLRIFLSGSTLPVKIPVRENVDDNFASLIKRWKNYVGVNQLFIFGSNQGRDDDLPIPELNPVEGMSFELTSALLHEMFAVINQLLAIPVQKQNKYLEYIKNDRNKDMVKLSIHLTKKHNPMLLLAVIDLALMRPIFGWDKENFQDVYPGWRFIRALSAVEKLNITPEHSIVDFQNCICSELGWQEPWAISKELCNYLQTRYSKLISYDPERAQEEAREIGIKSGTLINKIEDRSIGETRMQNIYKAHNIRSKNSEDVILFIAPGILMSEFLKVFNVPIIKHEDGVTIGGENDITSLGHDYHFQHKSLVASQIMSSDTIYCIMKEWFEMPGGCPIDPQCTGIFPTTYTVNQNCFFVEWFANTFGFSLNDLIS